MEIIIKTANLADLKTYYINDETEEFTINGKEISFNCANATYFILKVIANWPQKLEEDVLDGFSFKLTIKTQSKQTSYLFKNRFPDNFNLLLNFLCEVEYV